METYLLMMGVGSGSSARLYTEENGKLVPYGKGFIVPEPKYKATKK